MPLSVILFNILFKLDKEPIIIIDLIWIPNLFQIWNARCNIFRLFTHGFQAFIHISSTIFTHISSMFTSPKQKFYFRKRKHKMPNKILYISKYISYLHSRVLPNSKNYEREKKRSPIHCKLYFVRKKKKKNALNIKFTDNENFNHSHIQHEWKRFRKMESEIYFKG